MNAKKSTGALLAAASMAQMAQRISFASAHRDQFTKWLGTPRLSQKKRRRRERQRNC